MWKIQLIITINFISSLVINEKRLMHSKSDNIEIMINDEAYEFKKELFNSIKNRSQINWNNL